MYPIVIYIGSDHVSHSNVGFDYVSHSNVGFDHVFPSSAAWREGLMWNLVKSL